MLDLLYSNADYFSDLRKRTCDVFMLYFSTISLFLGLLMIK